MLRSGEELVSPFPVPGPWFCGGAGKITTLSELRFAPHYIVMPLSPSFLYGTPWTLPGFTTVTRGFPGGTSGKEYACQSRRCKRHRFDPWVGKIPWRRAWQPTPVFLPGESHGQRSLRGYSPWGRRELGTTEWLTFPHFFQESCTGCESWTMKKAEC